MAPFSKSAEPRFTVNSAKPNAGNHPIASELRRLFFIAVAIWVWLALFSYAPSDPSWTTWSTQTQFHNWMGRMGSTASDILFQLFGLTALAIPTIPLAFAFRRADQRGNWKTDLVAPWGLLISLSALVQCFVRGGNVPFHLHVPGGIIGSLSNRFLSFLSGDLGAKFLSLTLFIASLMIVFRLQLLKLTSHFFTIVLPAGAVRAKEFFQKHSVVFQKLQNEKIFVWRTRLRALLSSPSAPPSIPIAVHAPVAPTAIHEPAGPTPTEKPESVEASPLLGLVSDPVQVTKLHSVPKTRIHRGTNRDFQLPSLSLLSGKAESKVKTVDKSWYVEKANILTEKLRDFGVEGEVVHISPGPVITVYEFKPASGVKIKEISNLSDDLTLALSALSVRIVAPIPGKPVVGIEIPSPHREMVFFKDMIQETPFFKGELKIPVVLGRMASGEPLAADLASMPHLLIAGTTGTGKSVFINTLICSLLYRFSPEQLRLILVDPKMVELSSYENIPHLLLPVVVDSKKAVLALRWTVEEMERRYSLMHQFGVRHVDMYNERINEMKSSGTDSEFQLLPYIVVVIDEYADLMAVVPKEVELSIARLAQKARASGIHLVLGTQRPSTDVVTGTIKANFPSRISFRVASSVDSKTILDRTGADRLLGHGDMLFHSAGFSTLKRMQGPFISDADISRVVEHLKSQGAPEYDERILQQSEELEQLGLEGMSAEEGESENALYDRAVRIVTEKGEASISLIQRHLRIGYNRAATLMERMEKEGVVGGSTGPAKRRSVLVNSL